MRKNVKANMESIITDFNINLIPMITLAAKYQVSRQYIWRILKQAGVNTTKHKITVSCSCCSKPILRPKCQIRNRNRLFCSSDCWYAWINARNEEYIPNRTGNRIARSIASAFYPLKPEHIVHHSDNNTFNNSPNNLVIFANQGDHIRHHRGFTVTPLYTCWKKPFLGRKV